MPQSFITAWLMQYLGEHHTAVPDVHSKSFAILLCKNVFILTFSSVVSVLESILTCEALKNGMPTVSRLLQMP